MITTTKLEMSVICILISFVVLFYAIDLFEFHMSDWNLQHNHIPPLIVISKPINKTKNIILSHSNQSNTLLTNTNTNNIKYVKDSTNLSNLFSNPHHYINGNPLQYKQCRNAILIKENINIHDFISKHTKHLSKATQKQIWKHVSNIIWSRELLHALSNKLKYGHLVRVRLSYDANNKNWQGSRARQYDEPLNGYSIESRNKSNIEKKLLIYYHVSKCGSSSIHNMLNMHYNTTRMYWRDLLSMAVSFFLCEK